MHERTHKRTRKRARAHKRAIMAMKAEATPTPPAITFICMPRTYQLFKLLLNII